MPVKRSINFATVGEKPIDWRIAIPSIVLIIIIAGIISKIAVIDRFANPFIKHMLTSIELNAVSKFDVRVLPTILEYKEKFGKYPEGLVMSLAAMIVYYHKDVAQDAPEILDYMKLASVEEIMRWDVWHTDISDMTPLVRKYYDIITKDGMEAAYEEVFKNS